MIREGFLTPRLMDAPAVHYDFSRLLPRENGLFSELDIERELKRQTRVTPQIVRQILDYAEDRQGHDLCRDRRTRHRGHWPAARGCAASSPARPLRANGIS